ncbi:MAG TPA: hypothetical protein VF173_12535 [Thermoanaerobaculia bacterium]|nr:hypothetical protein [Thermoanaerobaculia bacterium]
MPRNSDEGALSHWYELFEDFSTSTQDFYAAVEEAIRSRKIPDITISRVLFNEGGVWTAKREYLRIKRGRIVVDICSAPYGTSHFFSWWVAKVPARYGLFKVLGLAFLLSPLWNILLVLALKAVGETLSAVIFLSFLSFLGVPIILLLLGIAVERGYVGNEEWVLSVPIIGYLYALVFKPLTYYRLDSAYMFRDSMAAIVGEVVNGLREEKGLRLLEPEELAPQSPKALAS